MKKFMIVLTIIVLFLVAGAVILFVTPKSNGDESQMESYSDYVENDDGGGDIYIPEPDEVVVTGFFVNEKEFEDTVPTEVVDTLYETVHPIMVQDFTNLTFVSYDAETGSITCTSDQGGITFKWRENTYVIVYM